MTGAITNIQKFSLDDGPGIRTTVFFKGCTLRCRWCHNPETIYGDESDEYTPEALMEVLEEDEDFYTTSGGGVTFSGGEALLQTDFLIECIRQCKERGYHVCIDTAGNVPFDLFERVLKVLSGDDIFLYDCKCFNPDVHEKGTGCSNELIKENLKKLAAKGVRIWIRVPVIPGFNDNEDELGRVAGFLKGTGGIEKIELLGYHRYGIGKYEKLGIEYLPGDAVPPTEQEMKNFNRIFENIIADE